MKREIKIYKTPEEQEMFYKAFWERVDLQESLQRGSLDQLRELQYDQLPKNKKIISEKDTFSAS